MADGTATTARNIHSEDYEKYDKTERSIAELIRTASSKNSSIFHQCYRLT